MRSPAAVVGRQVGAGKTSGSVAFRTIFAEPPGATRIVRTGARLLRVAGDPSCWRATSTADDARIPAQRAAALREVVSPTL